MQLHSKVQPVYLPERDQTTVLRLGLRRLEPRQWLVVDDDFAQFHRHKLDCGERQREKVYRELPEAGPARRELRQLVLQHLINDHSRYFEISDSELRYRPEGLCWSLADDSLWQTSLWVPEDFCLMETRQGDYHLTAASVCSPSNWRLEDKIGCSLDSIHGPVPGYGSQLSARVNRLFASLRPERPLLRFNWSVQQGAELLSRDGPSAPDRDNGQGSERYWRVERQTLRRLPETGAIVFTIRIFLHSFGRLARIPGFTQDVTRLMQGLPDAQKAYKGLSIR